MNVTNVSNKMTIDNFTVNGGQNDLNDVQSYSRKTVLWTWQAASIQAI